MKKLLKYKIIFTYSIILVIVFVAGFALGRMLDEGSSTSELRSNTSEGLTNQLLECELGKDTIASRKLDFSEDLKDVVADLKEKNKIKDISVYFRDLNNGPVIDIDAAGQFSPASLLKVPILIAYLKWSEDEEGVLSKEIKFEKVVDVGYQQKFAPTVDMTLGKSYSVKELLEQMIIYSDNQALVLLYDRLPPKYLKDLYTLLGVDPDIAVDASKTLSIEKYSIFFRVLFNASYLSRNNSEYALTLLSRTTFDQGIRSSAPGSITVAHKFGERKSYGDIQQFHDCGIVYYPNHPYLLCVMTRGQEVTSLIDTIKQTSDFVYSIIDKQYSNK
jgi:beta-lactamase class A